MARSITLDKRFLDFDRKSLFWGRRAARDARKSSAHLEERGVKVPDLNSYDARLIKTVSSHAPHTAIEMLASQGFQINFENFDPSAVFVPKLFALGQAAFLRAYRNSFPLGLWGEFKENGIKKAWELDLVKEARENDEEIKSIFAFLGRYFPDLAAFSFAFGFTPLFLENSDSAVANSYYDWIEWGATVTAATLSVGFWRPIRWALKLFKKEEDSNFINNRFFQVTGFGLGRLVKELVFMPCWLAAGTAIKSGKFLYQLSTAYARLRSFELSSQNEGERADAIQRNLWQNISLIIALIDRWIESDLPKAQIFFRSIVEEAQSLLPRPKTDPKETKHSIRDFSILIRMGTKAAEGGGQLKSLQDFRLLLECLGAERLKILVRGIVHPYLGFVLSYLKEAVAMGIFSSLSSAQQFAVLSLEKTDRVLALKLLSALSPKEAASHLEAMPDEMTIKYFEEMDAGLGAVLLIDLSFSKSQQILHSMRREKSLPLLAALLARNRFIMRIRFVSELDHNTRTQFLEYLSPETAASFLEEADPVEPSKPFLSRNSVCEAIAAMPPKAKAAILGKMQSQTNKGALLLAHNREQMADIFEEYICRDALDLLLLLNRGGFGQELIKRMLPSDWFDIPRVGAIENLPYLFMWVLPVSRSAVANLLEYTSEEEFESYLLSALRFSCGYVSDGEYAGMSGSAVHVIDIFMQIGPKKMIPQARDLVNGELDSDLAELLKNNLSPERLRAIIAALPDDKLKIGFLFALPQDKFQSTLGSASSAELAGILAPLSSNWDGFNKMGGLALFQRLEVNDKVAVMEAAPLTGALELLGQLADAELNQAFTVLSVARLKAIFETAGSGSAGWFRPMEVWASNPQRFAEVLNQVRIDAIFCILKGFTNAAEKSPALIDLMDDQVVADLFVRFGFVSAFSISYKKINHIIGVLYAADKVKMIEFTDAFKKHSRYEEIIVNALHAEDVPIEAAAHILDAAKSDEVRARFFSKTEAKRGTPILVALADKKSVIRGGNREHLKNVLGGVALDHQLPILKNIQDDPMAMAAALSAIPETYGSDPVRKEIALWFKNQRALPAASQETLKESGNSFVRMNLAAHPGTDFDILCQVLDQLQGLSLSYEADGKVNVVIKRGENWETLAQLHLPDYRLPQLSHLDFFPGGKSAPADGDFTFAFSIEKGSDGQAYLKGIKHARFQRMAVALLPHLRRSVSAIGSSGVRDIFSPLEIQFIDALGEIESHFPQEERKTQEADRLTKYLLEITSSLDGKTPAEIESLSKEAIELYLDIFKFTHGDNILLNLAAEAIPTVKHYFPDASGKGIFALFSEQEPLEKFKKLKELLALSREAAVAWERRFPSDLPYFGRLAGAHIAVQKYMEAA